MSDEKQRLTVFFHITEGDVWIDPDDIAWYVKGIEGGDVYFERTVVVGENCKTVARKWRKLGDDTA